MSNEEKKSKWNFIPGFIRHDFLRKLIALFFAVLIWQRVNSEIAEPDTLRDIPVHISLPADLEQTSDNPVKVNLKVKGSRRLLNKLKVKDINIDVRIDEKANGQKDIKYRIDPKEITVPSGITVLEVEPSVIKIPVDIKVSKTVPVELSISGYLLDGYSYKKNSIIPSSVSISGPKNLVDDIKEIKAEPIILRPENVADFECEVNLKAPKNITVSRKAVTAQIEVYKKYEIREFENVLVKPFGTPETPAKIDLKPDKVYVRIKGVKKSVEIMNDRELNPLVDVSKLKVPGKYSIKVKCWLGDNDVEIQEIKPEKIDVELKTP